MHKRVKNQLMDFYIAKGLKGAALNSCVRRDYNLVISNADFPEDSWDSDYTLKGLFSWAQSPEGFDYWCNRNGKDN